MKRLLFNIHSNNLKCDFKINIENAAKKSDLIGDKNNPNKDLNPISLIVMAKDKINKDLGLVIKVLTVQQK
ncbi:hypothetical protein [Niallia sp. FSL W8-1348]|uniref:hypothetical protein n=1 Tax=Niallia sp. FSL W8-1348 TaxID=2954656 RepID=UPI0030FD19AA